MGEELGLRYWNNRMSRRRVLRVAAAGGAAIAAAGIVGCDSGGGGGNGGNGGGTGTIPTGRTPTDGTQDGPGKPGGLLRVRVETAAGLPAPGCGLRFVLRGSPMSPTDCPYAGTDARGRCEIRLPAGTWDAKAGWEGGTAEAALAEGSTMEVRLVVK